MNRRLTRRIEDKKFVYVNPPYECRGFLMRFLESEGFHGKEGEAYSWERIRESVLPIVVDFNAKEFSCLLTVESSVAAASADEIFTDRDLYECMGVPVDMRFKEFRDEIKTRLVNLYGYTEEETEEYLNCSSTLQVLIKNYEKYTRFGECACSPIATSSCLDMMYC